MSLEEVQAKLSAAAASGDLRFDPTQFNDCVTEVAKLATQLKDAKKKATNITNVTGWQDADPNHITMLQTAAAKRHSGDSDAIIPVLQQHIDAVESILAALTTAGLNIKDADQSTEDRMNQIRGLIDGQKGFVIPEVKR